VEESILNSPYQNQVIPICGDRLLGAGGALVKKWKFFCAEAIDVRSS